LEGSKILKFGLKTNIKKFYMQARPTLFKVFLKKEAIGSYVILISGKTF